jgi:1-aminocyclopropane-1-carboxylate deaminase
MSIAYQNCRVDQLQFLAGSPAQIDVLRLDLVHPVVSGNKWFKLNKYVEEAKATGKNVLLTFGGAYSNHIVATAAAAQMQNLKSIGIIRGEEPAAWSHTLTAAKQFGMDLFFVQRSEYKQKQVPPKVFQRYHEAAVYMIPEGGYGWKGAEGAAKILAVAETATYTHIVTAVGTGTTLAGLVQASLPHQKIIGIPVLKNAFSLQTEITNLLPEEKHGSFQLAEGYHFGGYAKHSAELIQFMNHIYQRHSLPTDFVYTAKALCAVFDLIRNNFFAESDRILFIHTGGLQGNASLPKGTLIFHA